MPLIEGESLRARLLSERQFPVAEALRLAREAAEALAYAHAHGVVHRDIKPENILLSHGHALVTDFGIARAVDPAGSERLTSIGLVVGTPVYMSPEQASGEVNVDGRSDVYSLGCVLYEMLAGEPPFSGSSVQAIISRRFTERAPSVQAARASLPPEVDAVTGKAMATRPEDRFATASDFAHALEDAAIRGVGSRHHAASEKPSDIQPTAQPPSAVAVQQSPEPPRPRPGKLAITRRSHWRMREARCGSRRGTACRHTQRWRSRSRRPATR